MALPTSGALSLNDIHVEAGGTSATTASLNDSDIRGLIGKASGATNSISEYYGASAELFDLSAMTNVTTTSVMAGTHINVQNNGTKVLDFGANVDEWDLTTPYDVSSATSKYTRSTTGNAITGCFAPDGTSAYILNNNADDILFYRLSTPWELSSTNYIKTVINFSSGSIRGINITFNPSGGYYIYFGYTPDFGSGGGIRRYSASNLQFPSTGSYQNYAISGTNVFLHGVHDEGRKMFYSVDPNRGTVVEVTLSTPYTISSGATVTDSYQFSTSNLEMGSFSEDGEHFFCTIQGQSVTTRWSK